MFTYFILFGGFLSIIMNYGIMGPQNPILFVKAPILPTSSGANVSFP